MQSRMNKYQTKSQTKFERSSKNTKLYEDVYDDMYRDTTYKNMEVIDSAKEINLNKLKDILTDKYDTRQYRTFKSYTKEEDEVELPKTSNKVYDINEIIDSAKNKRAFIEEAREKQKYMEFTQRRNKDYEEDKLKELMNKTEEKEISNTSTNISSESLDALDILSELKGNDNTIVTEPISQSEELGTMTRILDNQKTGMPEDIIPQKVYETDDAFEAEIEKTLIKADKTFYTDSNMFTKNDFEDFGDLSKSLSKTGKLKKVLIVLIILIILVIVAYFILNKFILK